MKAPRKDGGGVQALGAESEAKLRKEACEAKRKYEAEVRELRERHETFLRDVPRSPKDLVFTD